MSDGTTLLFALPGYRVPNVAMTSDGGRVVLIESTAAEGGCPACGVLSAAVKDPAQLPGEGSAAWAGAAAGVGA